ncbi:MAG: ShlB/FhaC/HecB family hemolysin secretion/activation protein [Rubrivivax sp.]|nr:ShlB/FhaC/HecB family hemolysin secretion/activation protein [Rubrivivax sp.]
MGKTGLRHLICSVVGLAGLGCPAAADAADAAPVDAGTLLQQQRAVVPPAAPSPAVPVPGSPTRLDEQADDGLRFHVLDFRLEGDPQVFSPEALLALLAPARGQMLSLAELRAVLGRITALYQAHGHFLARAVLPPQDVTDGRIRVRVLEGRLDPVDGLQLRSAAGGSRLDPALARRIVGRGLVPGQSLRLADLETGLHLLNDVPGVVASGHLEAGSSPDTTRVVVDLTDGPRWHSTVSADNHGSRYTDSERLGLQAQLDNPSGQGDQLALQVTASPRGDYRYARLAYSVLAAADGLRLSGHLSDLQYRVGADLSALDARGGASVLGVTARRPVWRSRQLNLYASAALDLKRLHNGALGSRTSDKQVDLLTLSLSADRSDSAGAGGFSWAELSWSAGTLDLSANAASLAQDQAGPRTQGSFTRAHLAASRVQRLGPTLSLSGQLQAQWAPNNLDSSEKFLLGGAQGVRAYPGGEAAGDTGVRASVELRWAALAHPVAGTLQLSAFVDAGRIRQWQRPAGLQLNTPNSYSLSGAGLGATLTLPGGVQLRAEAATPLARNPGRNPSTGLDADGRARHSRVWLSAQARF